MQKYKHCNHQEQNGPEAAYPRILPLQENHKQQ
jgi:hypothetical protein